MNGLNNFDKTDREYLLAHTDYLIRFWRSKDARWFKQVCCGVDVYLLHCAPPPKKKLLFWLDITSKNITDFDNFGRPVKMMTGCGIKILQNLFIFFSASNSLQTDRRVIVLLLNTRCYLNAVWHPILTSFQYVAGM